MTRISDSFLYNPDFHRFSDFLGLDKYKRENHETAKKVLFLYNWGAKKSKSKDIVDIYKTVLNFKKEVGTTFRGETLIKDLYRWARLEEDSKQAKKEKELGQEQEVRKEERTEETKERVSSYAKNWEDQKLKQKDISDSSDIKGKKYAKTKAQEQLSESKLQSDANIKVKEVINEPDSEELNIW